MNQPRSRLGTLPALLCTTLLPLGCASGPSGSALRQNDTITVTMHELPLTEVVKLAQSVSGRIYTIAPNAQDAGPFSIVGEAHCKPEEFDDFFAQVLATEGLTIESREQGAVQVIERH
ncbi:MAG: hypothetical protein NXI31_15305 [bacterium]|nr:hypothetical protein [bacterium]